MNIIKDIITKSISGDRQSQKQLYLKLLPYLRAVVRRYLYDSSFEKDALQETFIKIFKALASYDPKLAPFKKWTARICINVTLNYNSRLAKHNQYDLDENGELKNTPLALPSVIDKMSNDQLINMLKLMPSDFYAVFNLYIIEGFKHQEIAELLGITQSLSRKRLSRAREWVDKLDKKSIAKNHSINFRS